MTYEFRGRADLFGRPDSKEGQWHKSLKRKERTVWESRQAESRLALSLFAELRGIQAVALEQVVELAAIALGKARSQGDVALGEVEQAHQVVVFELFARVVQPQQFLRLEA